MDWKDYLSENFNKDIQKINEDDSFNYQMLGRLISDVEYYYGNGNKSNKHLWAKNPQSQADEIEKIYKKLNPKPEWISKKAISDMVKKLRSEK